ncbi:dihydrofolate reductase [Arthrobacter sp. MI7-26]|uniref:dihydrofolate reductase n=1 Tax=Arthrobacter sp. MI7-26 TaxID=2993653 RepID=UPI00224882A9|nr:dihydrofolate reductase [Arthrobacter sp. MI7-26]MCX2748115.1 dihydrofolate reductase [Arthrobacter sp. MI7-26]
MSTQETPPAETPSSEEAGEAMTDIGLVWAQTASGVIGKGGTMPWHVPEDLKHFSTLTTGHPVIMGRKTWESFPTKYRPLPGRTNIVVTRQQGWSDSPDASGAVVVSSLDAALLESQFAPGGQNVWIIGGGEIYRQSMDIANVAVVTVIDSDIDGDTFAPEFDGAWNLESTQPAEGWLTSKNGTNYRIATWRRTED